MWFVYVLQCADDSLYIGETGDINARLLQHPDGHASTFTARRRPVALAYVETCPGREEALVHERQLKRWTRAKKEALIAGDFELLKRL
ncbi:MAG: GIY-YIG nuclease family protein [Acidobacteria bacterium]|nr:GIY-YIG nuclease family protein [Acidobacteriota bacterium]